MINIHTIKTTDQWNSSSMQYHVIPKGDLCIELCKDGRTKIKIGVGNKYYSQLPYVSSIEELENYYNKQEVDYLINNLDYIPRDELNPIIIDLQSKEHVHLNKNLLDKIDVLYTKDEKAKLASLHNYDDTEIKTDISDLKSKEHTHLNKDILDSVTTGSFLTPADREKIDTIHNYDDTEIRQDIAGLTQLAHSHANKAILDSVTTGSFLTPADREKIDTIHNYDDTEIRGYISELQTKEHTHSNKSVLDTITTDSFLTPEDREKIDTIHNYDDTEIRGYISELQTKEHTHANKDILDTITSDSFMSQADREKLDSLHNYDDTEIKADISELQTTSHTHSNKTILDNTTASYTSEEKTKLASLQNYDDTEIKSDISDLQSKEHTHSNKTILDGIATSNLLSADDRTKFNSLHNYDDTEIKSDISDLQTTSHSHTNKTILDNTTASYTSEEKIKLSSLQNYSTFIGTDGTNDGSTGLVPAPTKDDVNKFLKSDGSWDTVSESDTYGEGDGISLVPDDNILLISNDGVLQIKESTSEKNITVVTRNNEYDIPINITLPPEYVLPIANSTTLGGVKIGNGLNIDSSGVLSVDSEPPIEQTVYVAGDGILFETDEDDIVHINNTGIIDAVYSEADKELTLKKRNNVDIVVPISGGGGGDPYVLPIATTETLGGIKVGSGLNIDSVTGVLSVIQIVIDDQLSTTSTNPVQNKVITAMFEEIKRLLTEIKQLIEEGGGGSTTKTDIPLTTPAYEKGMFGVLKTQTQLTEE